MWQYLDISDLWIHQIYQIYSHRTDTNTNTVRFQNSKHGMRLEKDQIATTQGCQCLDTGPQTTGAGHVLDVRQVEGIDLGLLADSHEGFIFLACLMQ